MEGRWREDGGKMEEGQKQASTVLLLTLTLTDTVSDSPEESPHNALSLTSSSFCGQFNWKDRPLLRIAYKTPNQNPEVLQTYSLLMLSYGIEWNGH